MTFFFRALDDTLLKEGSSETTRVTSRRRDDVQFGYWLAGLIDGDGSLLVSKLGHPYIEISLHDTRAASRAGRRGCKNSL